MPVAAGIQRYENRRHPLLPLDSGFRRNDECRGGGIQALLRLRSIIFVPMTGPSGVTEPNRNEKISSSLDT